MPYHIVAGVNCITKINTHLRGQRFSPASQVASPAGCLPVVRHCKTYALQIPIQPLNFYTPCFAHTVNGA